MKIFGDSFRIHGVHDKGKNVGKIEKSSTVASKSDAISISNSGRDFQTVMRALKDVKDVRQDLVDDLSEKYESGNYNVESTSISDSILSKLTETQD